MQTHVTALRSIRHILQETHGNPVVAFDTTQSHTQADMRGSIHALTRYLQAQPARRWLLVHENTYHFAIGLFALLTAGKDVLLPPNAQAGTLADLMQQADAVLDDNTIAHEQKALLPGNTCALPLLDLDALTITVLTSGSTGEPKAIRKTLRCLDAEIEVLESLWGTAIDGKSSGTQISDTQIGDAPTSRTVVLATVSHQHIYGLLFRLLWPLCAGRPFAAHTHQYPEQLIHDISGWPRSVVVSSPSQLKRFPPAIDLAAVQSHIAAVFSSGGLLPLAAAQDWQQRLGQTPIEVLGSTETGGVAWRNQMAADTPWQPLPMVEVTTDAGQGLLVHSPFTGLHTPLAMGDRGTLQADGRFLLQGRADRLVKIEEKRLSLTDMEQRLLASTLTHEVRVLVLPSGRLGVVATLHPDGKTILDTQGKQALTQQLKNHLGQHFERVLLPRKWRFPEHLPSDTQGKTPHTALVALFANTAETDAPFTLLTVTDTPDHRQLRITLPEHSSLFDGHFPGLPILPGVVQFDLAARQCAHWYPLNTFSRIDKLKFQEPVVPGDSITLTLQHLGHGQVQFEYTLDGRPMSSGRIVFATGATHHSDKPL